MLSCQLAVIGAGSAGCGAALAASRLGIDTVLVENYPRIGGISTFAGVNCYEPVAGATGISRLLFEEMRRNDPAGVGIYRMARHCAVPAGDEPPFPGAEQRINPAGRYERSVRMWRNGSRGKRFCSGAESSLSRSFSAVPWKECWPDPAAAASAQASHRRRSIAGTACCGGWY